jgi:hypothetical protein
MDCYVGRGGARPGGGGARPLGPAILPPVDPPVVACAAAAAAANTAAAAPGGGGGLRSGPAVEPDAGRVAVLPPTDGGTALLVLPVTVLVPLGVLNTIPGRPLIGTGVGAAVAANTAAAAPAGGGGLRPPAGGGGLRTDGGGGDVGDEVTDIGGGVDELTLPPLVAKYAAAPPAGGGGGAFFGGGGAAVRGPGGGTGMKCALQYGRPPAERPLPAVNIVRHTEHAPHAGCNEPKPTTNKPPIYQQINDNDFRCKLRNNKKG